MNKNLLIIEYTYKIVAPLTSPRSTVLRCSRVHPGLSYDPALTLKNLHKRLVPEK